MTASFQLRPFLALTSLLWPAAAWTQAAEPPALPMSVSVGVESVRLPEGERLGLVGTRLLFGVGDAWSAGPAVYGAATGRHGGFFVGGFEAEGRWALARDVALAGSLFVGGGGGGNAPVGGGLMLRPAVALMVRLGDWEAGVSVSDVRFPNGDIHSAQVGLLLSRSTTYRYADTTAIGSVARDDADGLGITGLALTAGSYHLRDGSGRTPGLLGARASWGDPSGPWHWTAEAAAAAHGDAAGYMELLGGLAWRQPLPVLPALAFDARAAVGMAGGGAMPSGGGLIGKAAVGLSWAFAPGWRVGVEGGWLEGLHGQPRAPTWQATLERSFERTPGEPAGSARIERNEWIAGVQVLTHVERKDGSHGAIETLGGGLNRAVDGGPFYLSLQAYSAFGGGAGAYSIGLVGAGVASALGPWRAGAEALIGASGGGGVQTRGGALVKALAWVGVATSRDSELRLGAGGLRSLQGDLTTPLVELTWSRAFGLAGR
jgi:hypothetical protein